MGSRGKWAAGTAAIVLTVLIVVGSVVGLNHFNATTAVDATGAEPLVAATPSSTLPPAAHLTMLPSKAKVYFMGDSWTQGYGAEPETKGYAFDVSDELGWRSTIYTTGAGAGYENKGLGEVGDYADRFAAMTPDPSYDLVVIQGGLNDGRASTLGDTRYNDLVAKTITAAQTAFPNAQVVIMGPLDPNPPPGVVTLHTVDQRLQYTTRETGTAYISPLEENWWGDESNRQKLVDPNKANHPNNAGHALLAQHFIEDVRALGGIA